MVTAQLKVDEKETTEAVLQIVEVAEKNGLKLPREFGLLLKQVIFYSSFRHYSFNQATNQALYFDRYQKLLAPDLDPLRDSRVRDAIRDGPNKNKIIDAEML